MPSKRYFITYAPIAHINGKLAPAAFKVSNVPTEEDVQDLQYYYGYRKRTSGNRSLFAIRSKPRILANNPYTGMEIANRALFTQSLEVCRDNLAIPANRALCQADYDRQTTYRTLLGYAVAAVHGNGGVWLEEWTA